MPKIVHTCLRKKNRSHSLNSPLTSSFLFYYVQFLRWTIYQFNVHAYPYLCVHCHIRLIMLYIQCAISRLVQEVVYFDYEIMERHSCENGCFIKTTSVFQICKHNILGLVVSCNVVRWTWFDRKSKMFTVSCHWLVSIWWLVCRWRLLGHVISQLPGRKRITLHLKILSCQRKFTPWHQKWKK